MPLDIYEGFKYLADTVEAVREMREAQHGGVLATAEEQGDLEAALEDEAGDGGAGPSGGPPPGGEAGTSSQWQRVCLCSGLLWSALECPYAPKCSLLYM